MQKGQALILIIVGLLIIAVVAGGAYYLGKSTTPKPSPAPAVTSQTSQPIPIKDASPAPNGAGETANWKTYTDSKNKFLLKYPDSWIMIQATPPDSSPIFESPDINRDKYSPDLLKGGFVYVIIQPTEKTLDQLEQEIRSYSPKPNTGAPTQISIERVNLSSGETTIKVIMQYGSQFTIYNIVKQKNLFQIPCHYVIGDQDGSKTCEMILSTFKFL